MRTSRLKIPSDQCAACYHVMNRTVNGEHLFGEVDLEVFRQLLWKVAGFCGVQVITYQLMTNHFHGTLRVPKKEPIDDRELLRRHAALYPELTEQRADLAEGLALGAPDAVAWRERMIALMEDLSAFMKLLKQRFTIWFNRAHSRFGSKRLTGVLHRHLE